MTHPDWHAFLGAAGARLVNTEIADFGDAAAELQVARADSGETLLAPLPHLTLIRCSGDDAREFLHNQLTSDVRRLADASAQPAAWCTAKGRMLASFFLLREEATYTLRLATDLSAAIAKRLRLYVLRSKVKIDEVGTARVLLGLSGPHAVSALASAGLPVPAADLALAHFATGWVLRRAENRYEIAIDAADAPTRWQALAKQARPVGTPVWRWQEIRAGWPLVVAATSEEFVPQMADFEKIDGVSFQKGCYPGQEVVARTRYLGKIKRHLYRLHSEAPLVAGEALWVGGDAPQACGCVVDGAPSPAGGFEALAVIQEEFTDGRTLHLGDVDGAALSIGARVHPEEESA
ncbi:folate-binding protein YgfZ [Rhodocyclus tenuis]|uniref:Folate-binding protein YgfZ n=1 Tax=Rhodocyclus gracilis TaxID=2929842 RepID=A0ABX0WE01_9RHOO|nr:folate-binding protein YgfZ [Rhodocyclus gracilis]NJA87620.1 folate-binding protein YgfZ [Rhodocyclus gracilis]